MRRSCPPSDRSPDGLGSCTAAADNTAGTVINVSGFCSPGCDLPHSGPHTTTSQTWLWDGQWRLVVADSGDVGSTLIADPAGGHVLAIKPDAGPWEWTGRDWRLLSAAGRLPAQTAFAADPAHHQIVGFGQDAAADGRVTTWIWDGHRWSGLSMRSADPVPG